MSLVPFREMLRCTCRAQSARVRPLGSYWLAATLLTSSTAIAQTPPTLFSVTARPAKPGNTCANAPTACDGATVVSSIGSYEFDIYSPVAYPHYTMDVDSVRFALEWPEEWTALSYTLCDGALLHGDPLIPGEGLDVGFSACRQNWVDIAPFLTVTIDCTTPGRLGIAPYPDSEFFGAMAHPCGEGYWSEASYERHVEVGDYCGAVQQPPCDFCLNSAAGTFSPWALEATVPAGATFADTITVGGLTQSCPGIPLCGTGFPPCLSDVYASEPWLHLELLSLARDGSTSASAVFDYRITADGGELGPGLHSARVIARGGCSSCRSTCMQLDLTVEGPVSVPDEHASGGPHASLDVPSPIASDQVLRYDIAVNRAGRVVVELFDVDGRRIAALLDRFVASGRYTRTWSAPRGALHPGVYFMSLEMSGAATGTKLVVVSPAR